MSCLRLLDWLQDLQVRAKAFLQRKMVKALNLITVDCSTLVGESYRDVSLSQRIAGAIEEAKKEMIYLELKKYSMLCFIVKLTLKSIHTMQACRN